MLPPSIRHPQDLVTSHRAVRDGFLFQALTKTHRAAPYVEEALKFYTALKGIDDIKKLLDRVDIRLDLMAAAGFSEKARAHLTENELRSALRQVLKTISDKEPAGWRKEVFYRYLLTKGDSLGGSMRNFTGAMAGRQFTAAVLQALKERRVKPNVTTARNGEKIQTIAWRRRLLLFDKTPKFISKNLDVILLNTSSWKAAPTEHAAGDFVACGELKGGIDPAGADEHWKTANSALERIRQSFGNRVPRLFFVGAAIETAMAEEIFKQLSDERLTYAANLTVPQQLADLANWLVSL